MMSSCCDGPPAGPSGSALSVFGDVLNPWLRDRVDSSYEPELLERAFGFLEGMARSPDIKVQEVLASTVFEWFGDDAQRLARAFVHVGELTRRMSEEVEASLGRKHAPEGNLRW